MKNLLVFLSILDSNGGKFILRTTILDVFNTAFTKHIFLIS